MQPVRRAEYALPRYADADVPPPLPRAPRKMLTQTTRCLSAGFAASAAIWHDML